MRTVNRQLLIATDPIFDVAFSRDAKSLALIRSHATSDVVLIRDTKEQ